MEQAIKVGKLLCPYVEPEIEMVHAAEHNMY